MAKPIKRRRVIEILAPTAGRAHNAPQTIIPVRNQPAGKNGKMYYGVNQKEFGTSFYATGTASGLGVAGNYIFDARFASGNELQLFNATGVYTYSGSLDAFVVDGQTFSGAFTNFWDGVMHDDAFIYTNGIDPIQYKAGVGTTGTNMGSALATNTYKAWGITSYYDHLNLYHTIENGTEEYKRVRWTKKGTLSLTASGDFDSGTAGAADLQDAEGEIKCALHYGPTIAIFAEKSIHSQVWVGGSGVYRFEKVVSGLGTPSRRGAIAVRDVIYFIGENSFYAYYGGDDARDIAKPIQPNCYNGISRDQLEYAWVEYDAIYDEVRFHVPTGDEDYADNCWVLRLENNSWSFQEDLNTAKGETKYTRGIRIGDLIGSIGAQYYSFGSYFVGTDATVSILSDNEGNIVKRDPTVYSVVVSGTSTAQSFQYVTPALVGDRTQMAKDPYDNDTVDFTATIKRWQKVNLAMTGAGTADVYYSVDGGASYTKFPESPLTLVSTGTTHQLDLDVSSRMLNLRVSNSAQNEAIGVSYVRVEFIPSRDE